MVVGGGKNANKYSMADSDCCDLIKGNRQALGQSSVFFRKSINDKRSLRLGFAFLKGIIQHWSDLGEVEVR